MCGFFVNLKKKDLNKFEKMKLYKISRKYLYHRGPDFNKCFQDKKNFLFHSRLSIQDLSKKSNQPMVKNYKKLKAILVYNGEIYNFKALRKNLSKKIKFYSSGDTEVLLNNFLINKDYKKFLKSMDGMFSFVIKYGDEIFFSRDRFGQKPLFFFQDKKNIYLSSEIKPILKMLPKNEISLNKEAVKKYFLENSFFSGEETFFKNIHSVKPGEHGTISNFNIIATNYYDEKNFFKTKKSIKKKDFINIFEKNILKHLIADKKFAIALSGGLDSQSLAHVVLSKSKIKREVMNYCIEFKGHKNSEFNEAKKFTETYKSQINKIQIDENYIINNFGNLVQKNEGPLGGIMQIGMFKLAEIAKENSFDILLAGWGLDECFGSYKDFRKNNKSNNFNLIDGTNISNYSMISKQNGNEARKHLIKRYFFNTKIPRTVQMCDRFSMASSIELRLPFLDHHFVEKSILIEEKKQRVDKHLIRDYMSKNSLYKKNWFKNKLHVPHPQNLWLKQGKLKDWSYSIISNDYIYNNFKFLSKEKTLKFWSDFIKGKVNSGYPIWQLLNMYYILKFEKEFKR